MAISFRSKQTISVGDVETFRGHLTGLINAFFPGINYFNADSILTWKRNLSFLRNQKFVEAVNISAKTDGQIDIVWRSAVLTWAAQHCFNHIEGDFIECGVYEGYSAFLICNFLNFTESDKTYYLYDIFDYGPKDSHLKLAAYENKDNSEDLYESVKKKFAGLDNIKLIKGYIPQTLAEGTPDQVSFMHIDMNDAASEVAALEHFWPRLSPGGICILDDYGSQGLEAQQEAHDEFFARHNLYVVELPTVQGLVIKPPK